MHSSTRTHFRRIDTTVCYVLIVLLLSEFYCLYFVTVAIKFFIDILIRLSIFLTSNSLEGLCKAIVAGEDLRKDEVLEKHADWVDELKEKYTFTAENVEEILKKEIGIVFKKVLEHAGVYKCTEEGRTAFMRFIDSL